VPGDDVWQGYSRVDWIVEQSTQSNTTQVTKMKSTLKLLMQYKVKALGYFTAGLMMSCLSSAYADVAPITTQGNKLLFGGKAGSISGNSLFWSNNGWGGEKYYTAGTVNWLKTDWNSKLVRAAMGVEESGGYLSDKTGNKNKVKAVVDAAIANDVYVIIDWHTHHAENYQAEAVSFFREMAQTYGQKNHVIYEIYNEPLQISWTNTIKPYAEAVIAAIRAVDPDNLIIVGTPTWSQDVDQAANNPITGYANIAYTLHFYANGHRQYLRDKASYALSRGLPLFVTEWGSVEPSGNGNVDTAETWAWVDFMKANGISNANWSINDKSEGASALTPGASGNGGWTNNQLTASGALTKDIVKGWPQIGGVGPSCAESSINSTIEAEKFCQMSGVQTENTSDEGGGQNVGWIDFGDWMTYSINVPTSAKYKISYRVASKVESGFIQLESAGGSQIFGTLQFAATGDWQSWKTVSHEVTLPAGKQTLGLKALSGGWNLNWIKVETTGGCESNCGDLLTPIATIQAENFSYMSGVQTEDTSDAGGGKNVGWIDAGDWMSYVNSPVTIPSSGIYEIEFRVASETTGGSINLEEAGGSTIYTTATFSATGGWQTWVSVKKRVSLNAGQRQFGLKANSAGFNINWIKISKVN
jgi:endoglucanase